MKNEESLDFRKVMQQQINQKVRPIVKKFGLKKAKGNTFILEKDNILYILSFGFIHSFELASVFEIIPSYVIIKGDYFDALPFKEEEYMRQHPNNPANRDDRTTFLTEEARDKAICAFDKRLGYLASTLCYCNEINTFEKFIAQVYKNIEEKVNKGIPFKMDTFTYYAFGVYDGMQKRYDEAREKLKNALNEAMRKDIWQEEVRDRELDDIKNNELLEMHCKLILMFLEALDTKEAERDKQFLKTFEMACGRIRKYYGIKN